MKLYRNLILFVVICSSFGSSSGWLPSSFAGNEKDVEEKPILVTLDPQYLSQLSPERRRILEDVIDALGKSGIKHLQDHKIVLPPSALDAVDGQIVGLSSLFKKATQGEQEAESLAYDEKGLQKQLTPEQLESSRQEGIFKVPSREFPGQFHVWKINTLLQKGLKNIELSYEKDMSSALGHILIRIPADFIGNDRSQWSVKAGVQNVLHGIRGILSTIVGLVEEKPKFFENEVDKFIANKKNEIAENALAASLDEKGEPLFDSRLYDRELTKKLTPELARIEAEHDADWRVQAPQVRRKTRREMVELYPHFSREQIREAVREKVEALDKEALSARLREDPRLETLSPGYGQLAANRNTAIHLAERVEQSLQRVVNAQEEVIRSELSRAHPILAKNPEWLDQQARVQSQSYYHEIRWDYLSLIPIELDARNLHQEAEIFRNLLQFQQNSEEQIRAELAREKVPANEFEFQKRIWNSENWIPMEVQGIDGSISFYPKKYASSRVATHQGAWRLRLAANETEAHLKNGLYRILVSNLWNGPVGIKALFSKTPFISDQTMDPRSGKVINDPNSVTSTYVSNLRGIWQDVARAREEFESTPDRGFLSKSLTRWINRLWNYGVKGVGGTAAVAVGQPILTACNAGMSCGIAATAPVWAPLSSLFKLGFNAIVYDLNSPSRSAQSVGHPIHQVLPIAQYCVREIGCAGVGQVALKAAQGVVYEPLMFATRGLYAGLRRVARTHYDAVVRKLVLNQGHVPAVDSFGAKRTEGPGISSRYFYQIQPEIALLALQASLEREELYWFDHNERARIEKPLNDYYAFFRSLLQPIGTVTASESAVTRQLTEERANQLRQLGEALDARRKKWVEVSALPESVRTLSIKLTQKDLDKTLGISAKVVEAFYVEHLKPRMDVKSLENFWEDKDLEENDFAGLTQHFYAQALGSEFLTALEETDHQGFTVQVKDDSLKEVFAHFPRF